MSSRGHYLVWGYLEPWARQELEKGGIVGLLDAYQFHFDTMIPFNADYVSEWDAINHPVPFVEADALYRVISPSIYADFYRKLRTLTDKTLFINEDTFNPDRAVAFEKHIQQMIQQGARRMAAVSKVILATISFHPSTMSGKRGISSPKR